MWRCLPARRSKGFAEPDRLRERLFWYAEQSVHGRSRRETYLARLVWVAITPEGAGASVKEALQGFGRSQMVFGSHVLVLD